VESFED